MMDASINYDAEAEATGWYGPEVAFGITYRLIRPGQSVLDIGIGTGLGSVLFDQAGLIVHGMDSSKQMLDACREKGFSNLKLHDLLDIPYPYDAGSMDLVVCIGVLQFFDDIGNVFREASRILRSEGLFVFTVGDRSENDDFELNISPQHSYSSQTVTMYRHSAGQIEEWMRESRFSLLRNLPFSVFMDRERKRQFAVKAYLLMKGKAGKSLGFRGTCEENEI
jgi:predicted TPR repeat methyltransferase